MRTSPTPWRGPATSSATRSRPRSFPSGRREVAWKVEPRPYDRTAMSAVAVENARLQWEDGYRRLNEHASDRPTYQRLLAQVDVLVDELNRRVGAAGRARARRAGAA